MPFPNQDPGIPLGPGSALPAKMPSLAQPDEAERARRKKAADFRLADAAKADEELRRWDSLPQGVDDNARRLRELARDRLRHQAQNIEQTGDAGVTPYDEEYLQLARGGASPGAVLRAKDAARTPQDMDRMAGRMLDLNSRSERGGLSDDAAAAISTAATEMAPEDAMPLLRQANRKMVLTRRLNAARAQRDNAVNYHLSRMNPAQYKAFLVRSAQQATDPMEAAHIQAQLGNHELAQAILQSHARQQELASAERVAAGHDAAEVGVARATAQGVASRADAENPAKQANDFALSVRNKLETSPPETVQAELEWLYSQQTPNADPATIQASVRRAMADYFARKDPGHPSVGQYLDDLVAKSKYNEFMRWAQHSLRWSQPRAMAEYYDRMSWRGQMLWGFQRPSE